jgi:hypothetical protein
MRKSRAILRIVSFFCLAALAAEGLQCFIDAGLRRVKTQELGGFNKAMSGQANARILINGSSRALGHYDPEIIRRATGLATFNFGRSGSQIDFQLAVLKSYLRRNAKPDLVIQNLDAFSFVTTTNLYDPGQYMPYISDPDIYQTLREINPDVWKWRYVPLYGYAVEDMRLEWLQAFPALLGIGPRGPNQSLGFVPHDQGWTGDFAAFRAKHPTGVDVAIQDKGVADLAELVALCCRQRVPLLLVYSPEYEEMQTLTRQRAAIFAKFHEIAARYGVPLWDYSSSPICKDRKYFFNSQHLNRIGAEVFSTDLAGRLGRFLQARGQPVPVSPLSAPQVTEAGPAGANAQR